MSNCQLPYQLQPADIVFSNCLGYFNEIFYWLFIFSLSYWRRRRPLRAVQARAAFPGPPCPGTAGRGQGSKKMLISYGKSQIRKAVNPAAVLPQLYKNASVSETVTTKKSVSFTCIFGISVEAAGIDFCACDFAGKIRIFLLSAHRQQFPDTEVRKRPPAPGWRVKAVCFVKFQDIIRGQLENAIFSARRTHRNLCRAAPRITDLGYP